MTDSYRLKKQGWEKCLILSTEREREMYIFGKNRNHKITEIQSGNE